MFDKNWLMTEKIKYRSFSFALALHISILIFLLEFSKLTYHLHLISFKDCLVSVTLLMFLFRTLLKNEEFHFIQKSKKYLLVRNNRIIKNTKGA